MSPVNIAGRPEPDGEGFVLRAQTTHRGIPAASDTGAAPMRARSFYASSRPYTYTHIRSRYHAWGRIRPIMRAQHRPVARSHSPPSGARGARRVRRRITWRVVLARAGGAVVATFVADGGGYAVAGIGGGVVGEGEEMGLDAAA